MKNIFFSQVKQLLSQAPGFLKMPTSSWKHHMVNIGTSARRSTLKTVRLLSSETFPRRETKSCLRPIYHVYWVNYVVIIFSSSVTIY